MHNMSYYSAFCMLAVFLIVDLFFVSITTVQSHNTVKVLLHEHAIISNPVYLLMADCCFRLYTHWYSRRPVVDT